MVKTASVSISTRSVSIPVGRAGSSFSIRSTPENSFTRMVSSPFSGINRSSYAKESPFSNIFSKPLSAPRIGPLIGESPKPLGKTNEVAFVPLSATLFGERAAQRSQTLTRAKDQAMALSAVLAFTNERIANLKAAKIKLELPKASFIPRFDRPLETSRTLTSSLQKPDIKTNLKLRPIEASRVQRRILPMIEAFPVRPAPKVEVLLKRNPVSREQIIYSQTKPLVVERPRSTVGIVKEATKSAARLVPQPVNEVRLVPEVSAKQAAKALLEQGTQIAPGLMTKAMEQAVFGRRGPGRAVFGGGGAVEALVPVRSERTHQMRLSLINRLLKSLIKDGKVEGLEVKHGTNQQESSDLISPIARGRGRWGYFDGVDGEWQRFKNRAGELGLLEAGTMGMALYNLAEKFFPVELNIVGQRVSPQKVARVLDKVILQVPGPDLITGIKAGIKTGALEVYDSRESKAVYKGPSLS